MEKRVILRGALEAGPHVHSLLALSHQKSCHLQLRTVPYPLSQQRKSGTDKSIMPLLHLFGEKDSNFLLCTQGTLRNHCQSYSDLAYVVSAGQHEKHCSFSLSCQLPFEVPFLVPATLNGLHFQTSDSLSHCSKWHISAASPVTALLQVSPEEFHGLNEYINYCSWKSRCCLKGYLKVDCYLSAYIQQIYLSLMNAFDLFIGTGEK